MRGSGAPLTNPGGPLRADSSFSEFSVAVEAAPNFVSSIKWEADGPGYQEVSAMLVDEREMRKLINDVYNNSLPPGQKEITSDLLDQEPVFIQQWYVDSGETLHIIGDLHSGIHSLNVILKDLGVSSDWKLPANNKVIFCGDYVDRGPYGVECIYAVAKLLQANPRHVRLIEGNHEDPAVFMRYGFHDEMLHQFNETSGVRVHYNTVLKLLRTLPAALFVYIEGKGTIQVCHGGISEVGTLQHNEVKNALARINQRVYTHKDHLVAPNDSGHHLKWADFDNNESGVRRGGRTSHSKGSTEAYCKDMGLIGIISGHQDKYQHMVQCMPGNLDIPALAGVPTTISYSEPSIVTVEPSKPAKIVLGVDTRCIITSAATPVRTAITYPALVRITN